MFDSDAIRYSISENTILIAEGKMLHFLDTRSMIVARTLRCNSPNRDIMFTGGKFYVLTAGGLTRIAVGSFPGNSSD